jgi:hypothetical protein
MVLQAAGYLSHLLLGLFYNGRVFSLSVAAIFRRGRDSCGGAALFSFRLADVTKRVEPSPPVFGSHWICGRCGMAVLVFGGDM